MDVTELKNQLGEALQELRNELKEAKKELSGTFKSIEDGLDYIGETADEIQPENLYDEQVLEIALELVAKCNLETMQEIKSIYL